jgi:hypothetical protein
MHIALQSAKDGVDVRKVPARAIARPKPKTISAVRIGPSLPLVEHKATALPYPKSGTQGIQKN